jgi:hypothetical protein
MVRRVLFLRGGEADLAPPTLTLSLTKQALKPLAYLELGPRRAKPAADRKDDFRTPHVGRLDAQSRSRSGRTALRYGAQERAWGYWLGSV